MIRYGVDHHLKSKTVKENIRQIFLKKFGVDHPMRSKEVKEKIDFTEINKKRIETLKKQNRLFTSKPEQRLYEFFCENFSDIKCQSWINRSSVDFYIKDIDVYVQLDGVYWHGLIDSAVGRYHYERVLKKDRELNEWFISNKRKLFRITDLQWYKMLNENMLSDLINQLMSVSAGTTFCDHSPGYDLKTV